MRTEMELTLEQTQQGVSYEVSNIRVISITMKMEILLETTSNKLMVEHAEFDESDTYVLERLDTPARNPIKKILLKLNLPDHRIFKDGGEERYEHVGPEVTSSRGDGKSTVGQNEILLVDDLKVLKITFSYSSQDIEQAHI
ncbi:hypothetical protein Tco_1353073 [Tanacetum coccineum]